MYCIWAAEAGNITPMRVNVLPVQTPCHKAVKHLIRGFPKIDHSSIDARIVLEQNKIQKKS